MKLSLLMDIGFFIGIVPIGDGYLEDLKWMMIGPNGGVDFTWWFCKKAGFFVAITGGFMFKAVDMGSEYVRGDVVMAKVIGTPNLIFLLGGVAF